VTINEAEIAWFVYDLVLNPATNSYNLTRLKTVYTKFSDSLRQITVSKPGKMEDFVGKLQEKLDEKLDNTTPPTNVTLEELL
jgi:hypothetical protein